MSASATATTNNSNTSNSISEVDDVNMFQAARQTGRRNALGDLGEQLVQANNSISSSEIDKMTPNFQSMSIKN